MPPSSEWTWYQAVLPATATSGLWGSAQACCSGGPGTDSRAQHACLGPAATSSCVCSKDEAVQMVACKRKTDMLREGKKERLEAS